MEFGTFPAVLNNCVHNENAQMGRTVYYRLFHPDNEHGKPAVQNLVNSAVQRCKDKNSTGTTSVEIDRINFYYHVTIISKDDGTKTILRCNPKWNKQDKSLHQSNSWFDWVEVNWESRNGKNYSVPAKLLLWGNVGSFIQMELKHSLHLYVL